MAFVHVTIRRMFLCEYCKGYGIVLYRQSVNHPYEVEGKCTFCNGRSAEIEYMMAIHNRTAWWLTWPQPDPLALLNPLLVGQN